MLATCLLAEYRSAPAFARANPRRLAKLRYDGHHMIGAELAYNLQARHICQDLDLWRRRLGDIELDIEDLLDTHEVGKLLTTIDGIGPQSAARIIAAVGDPPASEAPAPSPPMSASSRVSSTRANVPPAARRPPRSATPACAWPCGCLLGAVRRNLWLRAFYGRLRAAGKPPKLALIAAMRKLLHAVYSVAKNRKPFIIQTTPARAA